MSENSRMTVEIKQYDIDMFEPAPDVDLLCPICRLVLTAPLSTPCGHSYCSTCINRWLDLSVTCPTCRTPVDKADLQPADARLVELLSLLTMHCPFSSTGCDTLIQMDSYENHLLICPFESLNCRWKPCRMDLLRRDKVGHEIECDWRKERCPCKCQLMICIKEMDTHDCKDKIFENVEKLRAKLRSKQEAMAQLENRVHELKVEKTRLELRLQEINDNITEIHSRRALYLNHPLPALEGEGEGLPPLEGEGEPNQGGEGHLAGGARELQLGGGGEPYLSGGEGDQHLAGGQELPRLTGDLRQLPTTADNIDSVGESFDFAGGLVGMDESFHIWVAAVAPLLEAEDDPRGVEEEADLQLGEDSDLMGGEEQEGSYDFHVVEDEIFVPLQDDDPVDVSDVCLEEVSSNHPRQNEESLVDQEDVNRSQEGGRLETSALRSHEEFESGGNNNMDV